MLKVKYSRGSLFQNLKVTGTVKELRNVLFRPIVWLIFIKFPHETLQSSESLVTPIDWTRDDIYSKWENKIYCPTDSDTFYYPSGVSYHSTVFAKSML